MTKIALFANGQVGRDILKYLIEQAEEITCLHLCEQNQIIDSELAGIASEADIATFYGNVETGIHPEFYESEYDFIITVYWPWILSERTFSRASKTVNFHPAFLPVNRGWYPHVHSILDGSICGVTLHAIDTNADTGPIWCQKEVIVKAEETALDIYLRLQKEITELFQCNWGGIKSGVLSPFPQPAGQGNYHKKSEIAELDFIDLDAICNARELINKLRARSFGEQGYAYFLDGEQKIFLNISLKRAE